MASSEAYDAIVAPSPHVKLLNCFVIHGSKPMWPLFLLLQLLETRKSLSLTRMITSLNHFT